ncbi:uncharacterized protein LOC142150745 [Mixophyes fleayi]|uniref:uncharacterized protein LOC142150745 n=1 Tax=Mixophyes fleayi TaxID=3061075 RepID=UPI003F4E2B6A
MINLSLRILNIPQSTDLSDKSSSNFQFWAKAIEDSFRDVFGLQLVEPVVNYFINDSLAVIASVDLYFQDSVISKTMVIQQIINKEANFRSRNIIVDLFFLDPKAGVLVTFTVIQDYTTSLSNTSSSDANALQDKVLSLLKPELKNFYGNSLQEPPAVYFKNVGGSAAMVIQYSLNYTISVDSAKVVEALQNSNLTSIIRIASLYVNNVKTNFDVFTFSPRFINIAYSIALQNRSSERFKNLETNVTNGLKSILKDFNLAQLLVLSFREGSVISDVELALTPGTTSYPQVAQEIANKQNVLQSYGLILDPQSVYYTFPPTENSFPSYAVAIIVLGILVILLIPILIFVVSSNRRLLS